ncbi:hypothetical protein Csa_011058 [Cucumis sativus]|uniref:Uncharacterized protein n=1 Tax=Cucumis sativus TaxID=3659 RepID=A0A0A0L9P3_CUCSA|nr:hypothetical protein Csa_011058 [Cucumis sativus]
MASNELNEETKLEKKPEISYKRGKEEDSEGNLGYVVVGSGNCNQVVTGCIDEPVILSPTTPGQSLNTCLCSDRET